MTAEAKTDETATEEKWEGTDVCVAIHTAMRKYCDSKITSAAYNLVHLICRANLKAKHSPWRLFGDRIAEQLLAGIKPAHAFREAAETLDDEWVDRVLEPRRKKGKSEPENTRQWLYALQCTLLCFDEHDVGAAVGLLELE